MTAGPWKSVRLEMYDGRLADVRVDSIVEEDGSVSVHVSLGCVPFLPSFFPSFSLLSTKEGGIAILTRLCVPFLSPVRCEQCGGRKGRKGRGCPQVALRRGRQVWLVHGWKALVDVQEGRGEPLVSKPRKIILRKTVLQSSLNR